MITRTIVEVIFGSKRIWCGEAEVFLGFNGRDLCLTDDEIENALTLLRQAAHVVLVAGRAYGVRPKTFVETFRAWSSGDADVPRMYAYHDDIEIVPTAEAVGA